VKILGDGELGVALTVHAHRFSASARQKIEAAGGTVVVIGGEEETAEAPAPSAPEPQAVAEPEAAAEPEAEPEAVAEPPAESDEAPADEA
jgi:hypothetical protein